MLRMRGQAAFFRKAYLHGMPCGHPFHVQLEPSSQPNGGQVQRTDTKHCISRGETSANKKRAYSVLLCNIFVFLQFRSQVQKNTLCYKISRGHTTRVLFRQNARGKDCCITGVLRRGHDNPRPALLVKEMEKGVQPGGGHRPGHCPEPPRGGQD